MIASAVQEHALREKLVVLEGLGAAVRRDDAEMQAAVDHLAFNIVDRRDLQLERDSRCTIGEIRDGWSNSRTGVRGRLVEDSDLERPSHSAMDVVHTSSKRLDGSEQSRSFFVDALSLGRQRKACPPSSAQGQAKPGLQVLDMSADGGGAYIQLEFCRGHSTAIRDALEDLEESKISVAELSKSGVRGPSRH